MLQCVIAHRASSLNSQFILSSRYALGEREHTGGRLNHLWSIAVISFLEQGPFLQHDRVSVLFERKPLSARVKG
jgi:hypothetical protein